MRYIYVENKDIPKKCVDCHFFSKYKYCNLLKIKIDISNTIKHDNCPVRSIDSIADFYINLLNATICSYNKLLDTYDFLDSTKNYLETAKNILENKTK